jgi:hypothetical protein
VVARCLIIAVLVSVAANAWAQARSDRTYVSETIVLPSTIKETGKSTHASITEVGMGTPPLRLGSALIFGSLYGRKTWIAGTDPRDGNTLDVNDLGIGAVAIVPIAERWTIMVGPSAIVRSSFDGRFDFFHDATLAAIALASYAIGGDKNSVFSFGFVLTNSIPFAPGLPIAGYVFRSDTWRIDLVWPHPQAARVFGDNRAELGLALRFDYPLYRVAGLNADQRADYVRVTNHYVNAIAGVRLVGDMWLSMRAGVVFGREMRLADEHRQYIEDQRQTPGVAPFVGFVLSYRRARR